MRVLVSIPGFFPSTLINVARPLKRLAEAGAVDLDVSLHFATTRKQIARADALVMSHTINPAHSWILDCAHDVGTPLLYDLDENLLEPPGDVPGLEFHRESGRQAAVRRALSQAVLVRTYAPALQRLVQQHHPNVVCVDGPVDWTLVPSQPPARHRDRVHVVYATSRTRDDSIGDMLAEPLRRIVRDHQNVDVTIWGPRLTALAHEPRVRHREFVANYDRYFAEFARAGFDIGLAPMLDHVFYQCKTATKFREYAASRIAGIYSDVEIYRDCVTDGATGLLVAAAAPDDLAGAWTAAISRLVRDAALRERMQQQAEATARQRYSADRLGAEWLAQLAQVRTAGPQPATEWRAAPARPITARPDAVPVATTRRATREIARLWSGSRRRLSELRQLLAWKVALRRLRRA